MNYFLHFTLKTTYRDHSPLNNIKKTVHESGGFT